MTTDGATWRPVGTVQVATAGATQEVGVISCAHADQTLGLAVFGGLTIETGSVGG